MYNQFYEFSEKPFEVTPDPKFLYLTPGCEELLSALVYGICERRGFISVIGEVGTGKTMMLNALIERLDRKTKTAFIMNSDLNFKQLLIMALWEMGAVKVTEQLSKSQAIQRMHDFAVAQLKKDGNVVLIVDEAQHLGLKTMENLRMLSNIETHKQKLIQIILSGQPELDKKLNQPEWRQLVQRISLKRYSANFNEEDTYRYIAHRLKIADYKENNLFDESAKKRIWEYSGGNPRKINILCDNAFLIGYGLGRKNLTENIVNEAIKDLTWSPFLNKDDQHNQKDTDRPPPVADDPAMPALYPKRPGTRLVYGLAAVIFVFLMILSGYFIANNPNLKDSLFSNRAKALQVSEKIHKKNEAER